LLFVFTAASSDESSDEDADKPLVAKKVPPTVSITVLLLFHFLLLLVFPILSHFSLSFIGFTYFLLLSIPSLSTRIVPLRFGQRS